MNWPVAGLIIVTILGLISAGHAVMSVRTSQGTIAWAISLIVLPVVTVPLYWVFGRNKFYGYVRARRASDPAFSEIQQQLVAEVRAHKVSDACQGLNLAVLEKLAEMPFTRNNQAQLLIDGDETFAAIFAAMDAAEKYILVQFYIIRDDAIGGALADRLIARAGDGIRVYLLYDEIGSHGLPNAYLARLRAAGVTVSAFNSTRSYNRFQLNFRNHRKIVVVDGRTAFVGGHNVGDEYMGRSPEFGRWRDTHLGFSGPAALAAQLTFAEDWHWASGTVPDLDWTFGTAEGNGKNILVLPSGPADDLETCGLFFAQAIHAARHRLWIASPYFVPDESIMGALKLAALKGVDVRILLPDKPDNYLVYLASFVFIPATASAGVKFYRYKAGLMHQKVMLVDDTVSSVGTANLDNRSFRLNFEISVISDDTGLASDVRTMLERDFANSRLARRDDYYTRPFWFRFMVRVAHLMSPVL